MLMFFTPNAPRSCLVSAGDWLLILVLSVQLCGAVDTSTCAVCRERDGHSLGEWETSCVVSNLEEEDSTV